MSTGHGTQNLKRGIEQCQKRRGISKERDTQAGAQQTLHGSLSTYTPARHRTLMAMRCAVSRRPFQSVKDPFYLDEVEMLRPGTVVPSPATVSRDVKDIYKASMSHVKEYFEV